MSSAGGSGPMKPADVQLITNLVFFGGIWAIAVNTLVALSNCVSSPFFLFIPLCCVPFSLYGIATGVVALLKGIKLRGPEPQKETPPKTQAIMMICNFAALDIVTGVLGILVFMKLKGPEVQGFFQGGQPGGKLSSEPLE